MAANSVYARSTKSAAFGHAADRRDRSALVATAPVGLLGETTAIMRVPSSALSITASVGKSPSSHGTARTSAPASLPPRAIISNVGVVATMLAPGSRVARHRRSMASSAPAVTMTRSGATAWNAAISRSRSRALG